MQNCNFLLILFCTFEQNWTLLRWSPDWLYYGGTDLDNPLAKWIEMHSQSPKSFLLQKIPNSRFVIIWEGFGAWKGWVLFGKFNESLLEFEDFWGYVGDKIIFMGWKVYILYVSVIKMTRNEHNSACQAFKRISGEICNGFIRSSIYFRLYAYVLAHR